jgi:outer membrane autotransporter protein
LTLGALFNGGHGKYRTFNSFTDADNVYGRGEVDSYGGSVFSRYDLRNGFYTDGAVYFGSTNNEFDTTFNNAAYHYDFDSPYIGFHAGIGRQVSFGRGLLDVSLRYLGMWEESENITLDGENVSFASGESNRLRLGGRYYTQNNSKCNPCEPNKTRRLNGYIGAVWDYEFSGNANGYVGDASILAPSIRGGTAIGELGLSATLQRVEVYAGLEGYLGKREGFGGNVGAVVRF